MIKYQDALKVGTKIKVSKDDIREVVRFDSIFNGGRWRALLTKGEINFHPHLDFTSYPVVEIKEGKESIAGKILDADDKKKPC